MLINIRVPLLICCFFSIGINGCSEPFDIEKANQPIIDDIKNSSYDLSNLPANLEDWLVEYLNEQCNGENLFSKQMQCQGKISLSSLRYVGEFVEYSKPIRYWSFPCDNKQGCWVIVQPFQDSYITDIRLEAPRRN
ncbi:hypothetical protein BIT28_25060 [Photobacterium proteolyticum]|uniref:Uncharacterized protein n=1 Tax=Photobacterium proteolyticum TaxID=1903952 RepID=A0A1Q9GD05_9GAMM|nr:hypothetical protein BIT28_25060 [Photobacterium proteolyticum]